MMQGHQTTPAGLQNYVIRGGHEGRARLQVLARVLAPTTSLLLDRVGPLDGARVIDVGCGGGDVTFELARRTGANGKVLGVDLDEAKLALARDDAAREGLTQVSFETADVTKPWPVSDVQLIYARFILTHMRDPALVLGHARNALAPGGWIVMEDIDYAGRFCDPPSPALERADALYVKAAQARGGDPFIGRYLDRYLEAAGFVDVATSLVQPYSRRGEAKMAVLLTLKATADGLVATGLIAREEVDRLIADVEAFTEREDTAISLPRIFQALARKSG
jgi:ubiquinone/menaquinone biosynthesis C-methylase UbiE